MVSKKGSPEYFLSKKDARLRALIKIFGESSIGKSKRKVIDVLVRAIISQQLSSSASESICRKIEILHGKRPFKAHKLILLGGEGIRSCGVSANKVKTIIGIAEACVNGELSVASLNRLDDEEVLSKLTSYWGVGNWTAEIFMMFCLGRLDVLARNDAGLHRSHGILYPNSGNIESTAENWRPYRAVAAWYLWKFLDNTDCHELVMK